MIAMQASISAPISSIWRVCDITKYTQRSVPAIIIENDHNISRQNLCMSSVIIGNFLEKI